MLPVLGWVRVGRGWSQEIVPITTLISYWKVYQCRKILTEVLQFVR